jgi:hypothetical protein
MRKIKWLAAFFLPLLLVSFLQSQSLADLAKKEKERRAALKGKTATVITPAELAKVKKRAAVESVNQEQTAEEAAAAGQAGEAAQGAEAQGQAQEGVTPPATAGQAQAADAQKPAETAPAEAPPMSDKDYRAKQAELSKAAEDKQELVDLLTLKMNSLYQEFYGLDNMKSREIVQTQISDTYDKLLKAEIEARRRPRTSRISWPRRKRTKPRESGSSSGSRPFRQARAEPAPPP